MNVCMPFCPECGAEVKAEQKFCHSCGSKLRQTQSPPAEREEEVTANEPQIIKNPIPETSRLSGSGIEKFLSPGERVIFATPRRIRFNNKRKRAYVTNHRLLFYHQDAALLGLVKKDRLDEIDVHSTGRVTLEEKGLVMKKLILHIGDIHLVGDRGDLLELYKALQSAKHSSWMRLLQ